MKTKYTIAKPCPENWEGMAPSDEGRFCQACQHSVVDFSQMQPDEISAYLAEKLKSGTRVCGRMPNYYLAGQAAPPSPVRRWAQAAVAGAVLYASTGCDPQHTMGEVEPRPPMTCLPPDSTATGSQDQNIPNPSVPTTPPDSGFVMGLVAPSVP